MEPLGPFKGICRLYIGSSMFASVSYGCKVIFWGGLARLYKYSCKQQPLCVHVLAWDCLEYPLPSI